MVQFMCFERLTSGSARPADEAESFFRTLLPSVPFSQQTEGGLKSTRFPCRVSFGVEGVLLRRNLEGRHAGLEACNSSAGIGTSAQARLPRARTFRLLIQLRTASSIHGQWKPFG